MKCKYECVEVSCKKTVKCEKCGKRLRRQKTFWQTINPFNTNANGEVKTKKEIYTGLIKECDEWKSKLELCEGCKNAN